MVFKIILLFVGAVAAFWVSAVCGGGASLVLIPILNLMLPASTVPFALTAGTVTSSVSRIAVFKKHINRQIFLWFVPFSIPAVLLGAWLIKFINPLYLQLLVGVFLVANLRRLFRPDTGTRQEGGSRPRYVTALVGFLAGFVSGITGAVGLLFNRFYLSYGLSKEEIIATRAANEVLLHVIKLAIYIALGLYSKAALYLGIAVAAASVLSSYTIPYILPYISERLFKKVGYGTMVVSGIVLLSGTAVKIADHDNLYLSTTSIGDGNEATIHWRESNFVMEYAIDDGLEVERPVSYDELPPRLREKYDGLAGGYDRVLLEKVFKFGKPPGYEFYGYKNGKLTKLEWDETD